MTSSRSSENTINMADRGPPIDHGWAWVIAAGLFVKSFVNGGFSKSYGVFFSAFTETFERSASETQLVKSVRGISATITGPISTVLSERLTERVVVMTGALFMTVGFISAFFAESLEFLVFSFGIFTGVGYSLISGPSKVCLGRYFDKKRGRANSMAMVGSSIGQIVIPPFVSVLLNTYDLRGAMLIYGGLTLNVVITGALMRPLSSYSHESKKERKPGLQRTSAGKTCEGLCGCILCEFPDNSDANGPKQSTPASSEESYTADLALSRMTDDKRNEPVKASPETDNDKKWSVCSVILKSLKAMFDKRILTNSPYILFLFCTAVFIAAYGNQLTFIVPRAEQIGVSRDMAALMVSIIGGCNVFGRLLLGVLADIKMLPSYLVMSVGVLITSMSMFALPFTQTFAQMVGVSVVFGIFGSSHAVLSLPVMVDFVGTDLLAKAVGLSILFYGISGSTFAPLLGFVKDSSGSYDTVFYVTASMQVFAVVVLVSMAPVVKRCTEKREKSKKISGMSLQIMH